MLTRTVFLFVFCFFTCVLSGCPYSDVTLKSWSSAASWPSGQVPAAFSDVVIPAGVSIVLDVSPPELSSIVVDGGRLIWGNYDNLEIVTGALISKNGGEIWVGSEDCLFTKKAYITLTGSSTSTTFAGFGNKVLGVGAKGTLELHGTKYTSWTRLAVNHVPPSYRNSNLGRGMNVAVFNPTTGFLNDYRQFDTHFSTNNSDLLVSFLNAQPAGVVIAVVAADEAKNRLTPAAVTALQNIGSSRIIDLQYRSGWACIGVQGAAVGTAVEDLKNETSRPTVVVSRTFSSFTVSAQANQQWGGFIQVLPGGSPTITVADDVNWQVGQQIVLASSDTDYTHAEQNEILQVVSARQLKLRWPLNYVHWGQFESGVDERAEVGLLTRSIVVRGRQASAQDTYGGQTKFLMNFTNVHIENVEFFQMGQDGVVGSYPVHFHMAFDVDQVGKYTKPAYVKGCGIWKSFNRCVTIHGTSGLLVQNNVAYDHKGHCYFFEDGSEMRNTLDGNLGILTKYGNTILSDYDPARCVGLGDGGSCKGPATFWLTNPSNTLVNNVAAGSVAFGIWYVFPYKPTGLSAPYFPNLIIPFLPLGTYRNNYIHSSPTGLMVDDGVETTPGPTYLGITGARYRPHQSATTNSPRVPAWFYDSNIHHCRDRGAWLRGGDFRISNFKFADNQIGLTLASEGTMPNDYGSSQEVFNSLFVGYSNNSPLPSWYRVYGFEMYDGPTRTVNCTFVNYPATSTNSSAISAKQNNVWQMAPTNEVRQSRYVNVDKNLWYQRPVNDGDRNNILWDSDGTTTGRAGWSIVTPLRYFHTKRCVEYPTWNAFACPDKYGSLFITNRDKANTNYNGAPARFIMIRDERPTAPLNVTGIAGTPPDRFQPNVVLNKTFTLHFGHPSPPSISVQLTNFNARDWVRVGVCYPKDATFSVKYRIGNTVTVMNPVATLAAVDSNTGSPTTYYFDSATGLLFFKGIAQYGRNYLDYCGTMGCESVEIIASGPSMGVASGECAAYPKYTVIEP